MTCPWSLILPVTEPGFKLGFVWIQSCACLMAKTQDQNGWWWRVNKRKGQLTPWGLCLKCSLIGQRLSVGSWALGLNAKAYERKPSSRYIKFLSLHYFFNRFSLLPVKSPASRCMKVPTKKLLSLPPLSPSNPLPGSNLRAALSRVCSQWITGDIQYNG